MCTGQAQTHTEQEPAALSQGGHNERNKNLIQNDRILRFVLAGGAVLVIPQGFVTAYP